MHALKAVAVENDSRPLAQLCLDLLKHAAALQNEIDTIARKGTLVTSESNTNSKDPAAGEMCQDIGGEGKYQDARAGDKSNVSQTELHFREAFVSMPDRRESIDMPSRTSLISQISSVDAPIKLEQSDNCETTLDVSFEAGFDGLMRLLENQRLILREGLATGGETNS